MVEEVAETTELTGVKMKIGKEPEITVPTESSSKMTMTKPMKIGAWVLGILALAGISFGIYKAVK